MDRIWEGRLLSDYFYKKVHTFVSWTYIYIMKLFTILGTALAGIVAAQNVTKPNIGTKENITHITPDGFYIPGPANLYSQIVTYPANAQRYELAGISPYWTNGTMPEKIEDQAVVVMQNINQTLTYANLTAANVVRIRIYTPLMDKFIMSDALNTVYSFFGDLRPTSTLIGVQRLARENMYLEIDMSAVKVN
ncbi:hypothetical protein ACI68E_002800 [Malassezia pachydermatis]|uniref:Uncharacterized protein n=1 Tax=Malassezia pachydermatis TaxID=77020 RepID=A0A0M8MNF2_9BASI|nr:hypothetical protein Malapachy_3694 [Malassezia pachydermatis]KOS16016.1 hypothetical protein Malapachy_3694 [Malassezia pachydermatis]